MRTVCALILLLGLAACASVSPCPDRQPDGGIGGTGECKSETIALAGYDLKPDPPRHI